MVLTVDRQKLMETFPFIYSDAPGANVTVRGDHGQRGELDSSPGALHPNVSHWARPSGGGGAPRATRAPPMALTPLGTPGACPGVCPGPGVCQGLGVCRCAPTLAPCPRTPPGALPPLPPSGTGGAPHRPGVPPAGPRGPPLGCPPECASRPRRAYWCTGEPWVCPRQALAGAHCQAQAWATRGSWGVAVW